MKSKSHGTEGLAASKSSTSGIARLSCVWCFVRLMFVWKLDSTYWLVAWKAALIMNCPTLLAPLETKVSVPVFELVASPVSTPSAPAEVTFAVLAV